MKKSEFLDILRERISKLPEAEAAKTVVFYSEMIDDRIEDGMDEESSVEALGSIDSIVAEVCAGMGAGGEKKRISSFAEKAKKFLPKKLPGANFLKKGLAWCMSVCEAVLRFFAVLFLWGLVIGAILCALGVVAFGGVVVAVGVIYAFGGDFSVFFSYTGLGLIIAGFGIFFVHPIRRFTDTVRYVSRRFLSGESRLICFRRNTGCPAKENGEVENED